MQALIASVVAEDTLSRMRADAGPSAQEPEPEVRVRAEGGAA
ncbi:hypothetical protein [Streptomyces mirabilis]